MRKLAAAIGVFFLIFVLTLVMLLFLTGNLNREGLAKLRGREEAAVAPAQPRISDVEPLLTAIREKEQELQQREAQIGEEEKRLAVMRKELEALRDNLEKILADVNTSLEGVDEAEDQRLTTVAQSVASMEAKNAAQTLTSELFTPDEAAMIIERIDEERIRGNILNEMEPESAALVLQALKDRGYGS
jgi:flagellar motility protein MotE (MotC chaperone)